MCSDEEEMSSEKKGNKKLENGKINRNLLNLRLVGVSVYMCYPAPKPKCRSGRTN